MVRSCVGRGAMARAYDRAIASGDAGNHMAEIFESHDQPVATLFFLVVGDKQAFVFCLNPHDDSGETSLFCILVYMDDQARQSWVAQCIYATGRDGCASVSS